MVVALNYNGWRQQHTYNFYIFLFAGGKGEVLGNKRDILSYQGPNKKNTHNINCLN